MAGRPLSYTEEQAREAIANSYSWAESLRKLGLCPSGGAWRVLKNPNCAATLDTHCGRKNRVEKAKRSCRRCGTEFVPGRPQQRYFSRDCGTRWDRSKLRGRPNPAERRVERSPYEQLLAEIETHGYCWVGRKYGVSDNAVRKWVKFYERERARSG